MKGVIDRIEDGDQAVILIEEAQLALVIPLSELPAGSKVNTFFRIKEHQGDYQIMSIDEERTAKEAKKSADLREKLKEQSTESQFRKE